MQLSATVACNWPEVVVFMYLKTGKRPSTATCCHQSFISQCGHWNTSAYKWFMGTYCLPWTFFSLILDIISRTLYIMSYRKANTSLAAALNTTVLFYNRGFGLQPLDGQMDGRMDRLSQADRHTGMSEEARCRLARRERGSICRRVWGAAMASVNQDLPWRRWRAKKGRGGANGSGESQMVQNIIT